jgi:mono/diheme cytochrome c family protein
MQIKSVTVTTDKGKKDLFLRINILAPVIPTLTDAERARGVEMAKADRQAVFKADCAACHTKPAEGKYGKALYDAVCAICHDAEHRATVVPDLHNLKTPTNDEFWRTWTAHGKPGSLMPAFSTAEGGPLNDTQIATLAAYLNMVIPTQPYLDATNAPPAK